MSNGNNNVFIGPLIGSIAPVIIALIAAAVYVGSLRATISSLQKDVTELERVSGDLAKNVGSMADKVSELETQKPTPTTSSVGTISPVGPAAGTQISFSNSAPWGSWSDPVYCPEGQYVLYGLRQKVERSQGKGDDTGMNAVAFYCRPLPN